MSQAGVASPYMISGELPFRGGGAGMISAAGGGPLGQQYADSYNSALSQNQANYQNILKGYQQTQANQLTRQQAIGAGYSQLAANIGSQGDQALRSMWGGQQQIQQGYDSLTGQVLGTIQGVGASQSQAIQDAYKMQSGGLTQQLLNSGLGNTTVMGAMQRGPMLDAQKANVALANQMAQLTAGYQSQLGQSRLNWQDQAIAQQAAQRNQAMQLQAQYGAHGLQYQDQANQQATQQANRQLGWMDSVQSQYPDAGAYANILAQQGQARQADADRALAAQQMAQQHAAQQRLLGMGQQGGGFNQRSGGTFTGDLGRQLLPPQPNQPAPLSFGAGQLQPVAAPPGSPSSYGPAAAAYAAAAGGGAGVAGYGQSAGDAASGAAAAFGGNFGQMAQYYGAYGPSAYGEG